MIFSIEYKKGLDNKAADYLSRYQGAEILAISLLNLHADLRELIQQSCYNLLKALISKLQTQLRQMGRLMVSNDRQLRQQLIQLWYSTPQGGHTGMGATYKRLVIVLLKIYAAKCQELYL